MEDEKRIRSSERVPCAPVVCVSKQIRAQTQCISKPKSCPNVPVATPCQSYRPRPVTCEARIKEVCQRSFDEAVLHELDDVQKQALDTANFICGLKQKLTPVLRNYNGTERQSQELEKTNRQLNEKMNSLQNMTREVQCLVKQAKLCSRYTPSKQFHSGLPCSRANLQTPKTPCSEKCRSSQNEKHRSSDSRKSQGTSSELCSDLCNKTKTVDKLRKEINNLKKDMRLVSMENTLLAEKLEGYNTEAPQSLPPALQSWEDSQDSGNCSFATCPKKIETRLKKYIQTSHQLEKQLAHMESEAFNMQKDLENVRKEREHLEFHWKQLTSPCAVPACTIVSYPVQCPPPQCPQLAGSSTPCPLPPTCPAELSLSCPKTSEALQKNKDIEEKIRCIQSQIETVEIKRRLLEEQWKMWCGPPQSEDRSHRESKNNQSSKKCICKPPSLDSSAVGSFSCKPPPPCNFPCKLPSCICSCERPPCEPPPSEFPCKLPCFPPCPPPIYGYVYPTPPCGQPCPMPPYRYICMIPQFSLPPCKLTCLPPACEGLLDSNANALPQCEDSSKAEAAPTSSSPQEAPTNEAREQLRPCKLNCTPYPGEDPPSSNPPAASNSKSSSCGFVCQPPPCGTPRVRATCKPSRCRSPCKPPPCGPPPCQPPPCKPPCKPISYNAPPCGIPCKPLPCGLPCKPLPCGTPCFLPCKPPPCGVPCKPPPCGIPCKPPPFGNPCQFPPCRPPSCKLTCEPGPCESLPCSSPCFKPPCGFCESPPCGFSCLPPSCCKPPPPIDKFTFPKVCVSRPKPCQIPRCPMQNDQFTIDCEIPPPCAVRIANGNSSPCRPCCSPPPCVGPLTIKLPSTNTDAPNVVSIKSEQPSCPKSSGECDKDAPICPPIPKCFSCAPPPCQTVGSPCNLPPCFPPNCFPLDGPPCSPKEFATLLQPKSRSSKKRRST